MTRTKANKNYFQVRSIAQVLEDGSKAKPRRNIIGPFIRENCVTFLYAPPDYGKTVVVVQAAACAALGADFHPCRTLKNECEPKVTIVADLENDDASIYQRHASLLDSASLPLLKQNLFFLHEPVGETPIYNNDLLEKILDIALVKKAELIIIDNISKLVPDLLHSEQTTRFIETLERMRIQTGASIVIVGHTRKHNSSIAVQPDSYYGTSMLIDYFKEMWFLDKTKHGDFFFCHVKTKQPESYKTEVPVFSLGDHPSLGVGFNFQNLRNIADIQMPLSLMQPSSGRKVNLSRFKNELKIMEESGIKRATIADICDVGRGTITKILEKA